MYMCVHVCAYRCMCICMYMYMCMSVYMYSYTFIHVYMYVYVYVYVCVYVFIHIYIHARVGVHMHSCRRILFICAVQSLCYMRVYHRCFLTPECVIVGGLEVGFFVSLFMVSACYWCGRLCFGRGRNRGFGLVYFFIFAGVRVVGVCVLVYARTHT